MRVSNVFLTIVAGFSLVLVVFGAITLTAGSVVRSTEERVSHRISVDIPAMRMERELVRGVIDADAAIRGYALSHDPSFLEPYTAARKSVETQVDHLRRTLARGGDPIEAVDRIAASFTEWDRAFAQPVANDEPVSLADQLRAKSMIDKMREAGERIISAGDENRAQGASQTLVSFSGVHRLLWFGTSLAALLTFVTAWLVARRVTRDLTLLARAADTVASGERQRVKLPSTTDLMTVSESFRRMVASLDDRDRAIAMLSTASRALSSHVELDRAVEPFVDAIGQVVTADAVFIDALDEQGAIHPIASWPAARARVEAAPRDRPSVLARAIGERSCVVVDDPAQNVWAEDAAALGVGGRSYLVVPLVTGDRAVGTLRLVARTPHAYRPEHLELLLALGRQVAGHVLTSVLYQRLNDKNSELVRASQLKSDFLAMMSHELRTPLNGIIGFSEVLIDETFGPLNQRQRTYQNNVLQSGRHLLTMINDVLDLSKVEAGRLEIKPEPIQAADVVQSALTMVTPAAQFKRLALSVTGEARILADPGRTRQVLYNLVSNAVKFTKPGGAISVTIRRTATQAELAVTDTGIGIAASDLPRLFVPFTQLERPETRSTEGTGLGLALCKRLVELQGGEISVSSEPGRGSTFRFTVPLAGGEPAGLPASLRPEPRGSTPLVLVIDDDPAAREILRVALERGGYAVAEASTAAEGLAQAASLRPDAVLLDIIMPDGDGWEILRSLKQHPATNQIIIVVVSIRDDKETAFLLGASEYLVKPIDRTALLRALHRCGVRGTEGVIVAVDDDPIALEMFMATLGPLGYRLVCCNGHGALTCIRSAKPDVVLLDLMMPEISGFDLLEQIRASPELARLPVIVVTAKDLEPEERALLAARTSAIIEKAAAPADRQGDRLVQTLAELLREAA